MYVTLSDGRTIECEDRPFNDDGAQGTLYYSKDGNSVIKLYKQPEASQRRTLEAIIGNYNIVRDDPYWKQLFGWPTGIVVQPKLGVVMLRAPRDTRQLTEFLMPKWRMTLPANIRGNWLGHVMMAVKLARAIRRLHNRGLCHSDLSSNNVLVNPVTGHMVVIDCDGLVVPNIQPAQVYGTPEFMAPEIVAGQATPIRHTDMHALAVLIYRMLLYRHPLKGPRVLSPDPVVDDQLCFGSQALYIEHPRDPGNRPKDLFVGAASLGPAVNKLMERAFITGLHNPKERPSAADWERALVRMADMWVMCANPNCEQRAFALLVDRHPTVCPWCRTPLRNPILLPLLHMYKPDGKGKGRFEPDDNYIIVGWPNRPIKAWHIDPAILPGPGVSDETLATIEYRSQTGTWTLRNLKLPKLKQVFDNSVQRQSVSIPLGGTVTLADNVSLLFGEPLISRLTHVMMFYL